MAGCGGANDQASSDPKTEEEETPPPSLDLARGSFGGVALGDTVQEMQRVFGHKEPAAEGEPATALSIGNDQDYSPPVLQLWRGAQPAAEVAYRYEHVAFMVIGSTVGAIIVNDPRARDRAAGVGVGDELAQPKTRYRLQCGTANENTEYEPFPACVGRTARGVYVWFGKDPIRNITLARVRPEGV